MLLTFTPLADGLVEGLEWVNVTIQPGGIDYAANYWYTSASIGLQDDPPTVSVVALDADASEFEANTGTFLLTRSGGDLSLSLTVTILVDGEAVSGADYTGMVGGLQTVTFAPYQTEIVLTFTPRADGLVEGLEWVNVTIQPGGIDYATSYWYTSASIGLQDDPPTVSVVALDADASEFEANGGSFLLTRSGGDLSRALTVTLLVDGSATAGLDYSGLSGGLLTLTFAPFQTEIVLAFVPLADGLIEGTEYVNVTIQPGGGSYATDYWYASAGVAILDDD
jgi:hypothetical protein